MDIKASIANTRKGFEESFAVGDFYNKQTQSFILWKRLTIFYS